MTIRKRMLLVFAISMFVIGCNQGNNKVDVGKAEANVAGNENVKTEKKADTPEAKSK
ncbi:hypothetical protein [Borrelia turcica]|uniref:hypothetical protein n=1 Tax=Borrelia turcica TaxID=229155 RepID=UPI0013749857|nr:hypothetical protein [Borrelia turcica]